MTNMRSTLGGAFTAMGTTLMGIGVVPQLNGTPSVFLSKIALIGFICQGIGQFFTALFSADARVAKQNTADIDEIKKKNGNGGTTTITKSAP